MLSWQLVLILLLCCINPLFSSSGSTEVIRIASRPLYLESMLYGFNMGALLAAMLMWFSNAAQVISSDKIMALFGSQLPVISLMMSMIARLIPRFVAQGSEIRTVQEANSISKAATKKETVFANLRLTSVLMGWAMEDSLETTNAMRARGYGAKPRRTVYRRSRFRPYDAFALAFLSLLFVVNAVLIVRLLSTFTFYPEISNLGFSWAYVVYLVYAGLPLTTQLFNELKWVR